MYRNKRYSVEATLPDGSVEEVGFEVSSSWFAKDGEYSAELVVTKKGSWVIRLSGWGGGEAYTVHHTREEAVSSLDSTKPCQRKLLQEMGENLQSEVKEI